jgi:hypothetical protein
MFSTQDDYICWLNGYSFKDVCREIFKRNFFNWTFRESLLDQNHEVIDFTNNFESNKSDLNIFAPKYEYFSSESETIEEVQNHYELTSVSSNSSTANLLLASSNSDNSINCFTGFSINNHVKKICDDAIVDEETDDFKLGFTREQLMRRLEHLVQLSHNNFNGDLEVRFY